MRVGAGWAAETTETTGNDRDDRDFTDLRSPIDRASEKRPIRGKKIARGAARESIGDFKIGGAAAPDASRKKKIDHTSGVDAIGEFKIDHRAAPRAIFRRQIGGASGVEAARKGLQSASPER